MVYLVMFLCGLKTFYLIPSNVQESAIQCYGSNVFMASLDTSKAFDRVNHFRLYTSLMNRNVPAAFLNILINWYSNMTVIIRWNSSLSDLLRVRSGVRQGGVLSPYLLMSTLTISLIILLLVVRAVIVSKFVWPV